METEEIAVLIKMASAALRRQLDRKCLKQVSNEVTGMSGLILKYLADHLGENVFLKDLEAEFTIRKSSLTEMLNSLERKGYIRKSSIDDDGRFKNIIITEKGLEIDERFKAVAISFEEELSNILTEEESAAIKSGLVKIINLLK